MEDIKKTQEEIKSISDKIDQTKKEIAQSEGKIDVLMGTLLETFGIKSIDGAKKKLAELATKIKKYDSQEVELKEELDEILQHNGVT